MSKKSALISLTIINILIILSGLFYTVYAYVTNVQFLVLKTQMPAFIFGLVTIFFGIRYFKSLMKLKKEISVPGMKFKWSNFMNKDKKLSKNNLKWRGAK